VLAIPDRPHPRRVFWYKGGFLMAPSVESGRPETEAVLIGSGPFRVDLRAGLLRRDHEPIALRPKTWSVLRYLVEHPDQLITKRELLDAVWGDVAVTESVLNKSIGELRIALDDSVRERRLIQTVPKRGFRFSAPIGGLSLRSVVGPSSTGDSPVSGATRAAADRIGSVSNSPHVAPFVGRAAELQRLAALFATAREGRRQTAFITGSAGIGKTALVGAFLDSLERREETSDVWVARGYCVDQHGPREPYMPVLEALGRLASRPDAGRLAAMLRRVAPTWLAQTPWLIGDDDTDTLRRSLQFVRPERMLREFSVLMETVTAETPLVLVLEDLHWSDAATIDLLSVLAERDEMARLLLIATYRPADAIVAEHPVIHAMRTMHVHRRSVELALSDLTPEEVREYLGGRFPSSDFQSALGRRIHEHTDGHPLFVAGVVDSLVSRGRILHTVPGWALIAPPETLDLGMPDDVKLLIESQLDGLSPADRAMLQAASVAGEDFSPLVVAAALGEEEPDTEMRCEAFVRARRFLRTAGHVEWPDGRRSPRYAFSHELYRQVLYAQITSGRCMRLHQRIGQALETAHGAHRPEIAPRLAFHFERGRDGDRAVRYLLAAAAGARQRFANREVIGYLEAALAIVAQGPDDGERRRRELEVRLALGLPLSESRGFASEQVLENYKRATELCAVVGSPVERFRAFYARWYLHTMRAERRDALAITAELTALARRRGSAQERLLAHFAELRTAYYDGRFLEARRCERRINRLRKQKRVGNSIEYGPDPRIVVPSHAAIVWWFLGHPERAQAMADAAVARAEESGHAFTIAAVSYLGAGVHLFCRNPARGHQLAEKAESLSAKHGFPFWSTLASAMSGVALIQQGRAREGSAVIQRALAAMPATGLRLGSAYFHAFLAEGHLAAGARAEALAAVEAGLEVTRTTLDRAYEPELWRLKGELSAAPHDAERCFQRALALARASRARSLELRASTSLARAWQRRGRIADAGRLLAAICAWFGTRSEGLDLVDARALRDQLRSPGRRQSTRQTRQKTTTGRPVWPTPA